MDCVGLEVLVPFLRFWWTQKSVNGVEMILGVLEITLGMLEVLLGALEVIKEDISILCKVLIVPEVVLGALMEVFRGLWEILSYLK